MNFTINGEKADIEFENEKNVLDLLNSVEKYLDKNLFISGIRIDSREENLFDKSHLSNLILESIETINIDIDSPYSLASTLIDQSFRMVKEIQNDIKTYNLDHKTDIIPALDWIMESLESIQEICPIHLFDIKLSVNTLKDLKTQLENDSLPENVIDILSHILGLLANIKKFILSEFKITKDNLNTLLNENEKLVSDIIQLLQSRNDNLALGKIVSLSDLLEQILLYFRQIRADLTNEAKQSLDKLINDISSILGEIVTALENEDFVMISDLLEYELEDKLEQCEEFLKDPIDE